jgi:hypothetical protein
MPAWSTSRPTCRKAPRSSLFAVDGDFDPEERARLVAAIDERIEDFDVRPDLKEMRERAERLPRTRK